MELGVEIVSCPNLKQNPKGEQRESVMPSAFM